MDLLICFHIIIISIVVVSFFGLIVEAIQNEKEIERKNKALKRYREKARKY